jgi:hypothetical protein
VDLQVKSLKAVELFVARRQWLAPQRSGLDGDGAARVQPGSAREPPTPQIWNADLKESVRHIMVWWMVVHVAGRFMCCGRKLFASLRLFKCRALFRTRLLLGKAHPRVVWGRHTARQLRDVFHGARQKRRVFDCVGRALLMLSILAPRPTFVGGVVCLPLSVAFPSITHTLRRLFHRFSTVALFSLFSAYFGLLGSIFPGRVCTLGLYRADLADCEKADLQVCVFQTS